MGNSEGKLSESSRSGSVMERVYLLWAKQNRTLFAPLSRNVIREVCAYLSYFGQLVDVASNYLRLFDFAKKRWSPKVFLNCQIQVTDSSAWIVLQIPGKCRVFCCGGSNYGLHRESLNTAYVLSADGAVQPQHYLQRARGQHGLIQWRNEVLVFGGVRKGHLDMFSPTKTAESLRFQSSQNWEKLPLMGHTRHSFNPCLHKEIIYLSGGFLEAYSPEQRSYLPLSEKLPQYSACCVYVEADLLVIHTLNFVLKYRQNEGKAENLRANQYRFSVYKLQNSQPVVDVTSGLVYFMYGGRCISFSAECGQPGQVFS